jgi:hypothetical protein
LNVVQNKKSEEGKVVSDGKLPLEKLLVEIDCVFILFFIFIFIVRDQKRNSHSGE